MASIQDLPDEIILKIIYFLNIKDLVKFGRVSKRIRRIISDKSVWQKINLSKCSPECRGYYIDLPTDLVKMVIENGCKYLSLRYMKLGPASMGSEGDLKLNGSSSLIYLDLENCEANVKIFEEILASCHSLQKLSMSSEGQRICERKSLTSNMIRSIWYQNGHALQTLNLSYCEGLDLESIQKITKNCVELKNIDLFGTHLSKDSINFLVSNLTPNVEKIHLGRLWDLKDEHLKALVVRCNKLSVLNLQRTEITNNSLNHIVENLQQTLEKLDVYGCYGITYAKLVTLKSMPKLKDLRSMGTYGPYEKEHLKNVMPFVRFNDRITADEKELCPTDGIWDVEAKQLEFQYQNLPINDWPSLVDP